MKRVVFKAPDGLHTICGLIGDDEQPPPIIDTTFSLHGHLFNGSQLSRVTERAVYYSPLLRNESVPPEVPVPEPSSSGAE